MFIGHLGKLSLSAVAMASSFASVIGFSLLIGMSSALDTVCGQSYGAKQYHMLGIQMQRAMVVQIVASTSGSNMGKHWSSLEIFRPRSFSE